MKAVLGLLCLAVARATTMTGARPVRNIKAAHGTCPGSQAFALVFSPVPTVAEAKVTEESYDYIIAGGGLAGCVLAERLTADGSKRVLVLEAGSSNYNDLFIRMPAGILKLFRSKYDWQYETSGEKTCNGRNVFLQRGKVCFIVVTSLGS